MNTNNITIIIYSFCYEIFVNGILSLSRTICLFDMSDSSIIQNDDQSEFFSLRERILNLGRIVSYTILLIAGISSNVVMLNFALIILTLSIPLMGYILKDIEKFEGEKNETSK